MPKVIFKPLPPESETEKWRRAWRRQKQRPFEDVDLSLNGERLIIARGVEVDVPEEYLGLADMDADYYEYKRI